MTYRCAHHGHMFFVSAWITLLEGKARDIYVYPFATPAQELVNKHRLDLMTESENLEIVNIGACATVPKLNYPPHAIKFHTVSAGCELFCETTAYLRLIQFLQGNLRHVVDIDAIGNGGVRDNLDGSLVSLHLASCAVTAHALGKE